MKSFWIFFTDSESGWFSCIAFHQVTCILSLNNTISIPWKLPHFILGALFYLWLSTEVSANKRRYYIKMTSIVWDLLGQQGKTLQKHCLFSLVETLLRHRWIKQTKKKCTTISQPAVVWNERISQSQPPTGRVGRACSQTAVTDGNVTAATEPPWNHCIITHRRNYPIITHMRIEKKNNKINTVEYKYQKFLWQYVSMKKYQRNYCPYPVGRYCFIN